MENFNETPKVSKNLLSQELIKEIFKRPGIWEYQGGSVDNLWKEISVKLDLPVDKLRKKWAGLRKSFRNELKKIPRNIKNEYLINPRDIKSNWPHYKSMIFLVDHIRLQVVPLEATVKTEFFSPPSNKQININKRQINFESEDDDNFEIPFAKKKRTADVVVNGETSNSTRSINPIEQEQDDEPQMDSNLCTRSAEEVVTSPDLPLELTGDYHFSMSIVEFMNGVSPQRKIFVRTKILQLLIEELHH